MCIRDRIEAEGCVVSYIHGGGRIGVLVVADTDVVNDEIKVALKNVCLLYTSWIFFRK